MNEYIAEIFGLQNEIKERKKESNWYHVILDSKRQTMDSMKKELIRFRT
jgi:uncharacterized protein YhaN